MYNCFIGEKFIGSSNRNAFSDVTRGDAVTAKYHFVGEVVNKIHLNYHDEVEVKCLMSRRTEDVGKVYRFTTEYDIDGYPLSLGSIVTLGETKSVLAKIVEVPSGADGLYGIKYIAPDVDWPSVTAPDVYVSSDMFTSIIHVPTLGLLELGGFHVGDRVKTISEGKTGVIRYLGTDGRVGIEADRTVHRHHNDLYGISYAFALSTRLEDIQHTDEEQYEYKVGDIVIPLRGASYSGPFSNSSHHLGVVKQILDGEHMLLTPVFDNGVVNRYVLDNWTTGKYTTDTYVVNMSGFGMVRHADEAVNQSRLYDWYSGEEFDEELIVRPENEDEYPCLDDDYEGDQWFTTGSGDLISIDTYEQYYVTCEDCGEVIPMDDAKYIDDSCTYVCESCFDHGDYCYCERCEEYHSGSSHSVYVNESCSTEEWCDECVQYHATYCECCSDYYDDDLGYCPYCGGEEEEEDDEDYDEWRGHILNYSYKPAPRYQSMDDEDTDSDTIYLGVEDETDSTGDGDPRGFAMSLYNAGVPVYCKHDGSLDNGAEVVTHPCTIRYHLESELWDTVCSNGLKNKMKSHDTNTCGLHVHISRHPFIYHDVEDYEEKIILAIEHFKDEWVKVARRGSSSYASYLTSAYGEEIHTLDKAKEKKSYNRYLSVNLNNRSTVEIRIFKGTLKATTVKATLYMVWHMAKFILDGGDVESTTFTQMTGLLDDDVPAYVVEYAKTRGIELN